MVQKIPSQTQRIPNKILICRILNKEQLSLLGLLELEIEFELKFREPFAVKLIGILSMHLES
jgi:hypothetical protein